MAVNPKYEIPLNPPFPKGDLKFPPLVKGGKGGFAVNPTKTSPAIGAAYALQGIQRAIALFHAAPGCTFLGKVLMTQHLKEPVGLVGTDIKEMPTIMGGLDELRKKIFEVSEKFKPSLIGIIGTAISEVRGEDIETMISDCKLEIENCKILYIPCPDYMGGFGDGYAKAMEVIVENITESGPVIPDIINLLPSPSLTAADIEMIKDIIEDFGLQPLVLPDLSLSMDGSKDRFSSLPSDGTTLQEIKDMGRGSVTLSMGEMKRTGEILNQRFNIPHYHTPIPTGLDASDSFIRVLIKVSGRGLSEKLKRWRRMLLDGMIDTHFIMGDKRVAIGLDGEMPSAVGAFCREMGMILINPPLPPFLKGGMGGFRISDLEDLEDFAQDAELIISNSHGKEVADRLGIPLLRMGFPVYDRFGEQLKVRVGYRGTLNLLFEMANILREQEEGR